MVTTFNHINNNNMSFTEANIDIHRRDGKLLSVSVVMPLWDKNLEDNSVSIDLPLFGIKTFAENEIDAEDAAREVIKSFCISCDNFGRGLESELRLLGWSINEQSDDISSMSFKVSNNNSVINLIMKTGENFADNLELTA